MTTSFVLRRFGAMILTLLAISVLIFVLTRVMPGDPARMALGPKASQQMVADLRAQMHLDEPLYLQYYYWVTGIFRGDLGISFYSHRRVMTDLKDFVPATMELVLFATFIIVVVGVSLGVLAAMFKDTWVDAAIRFFCYAAVSVPYFVWALALILLFGYVLSVLPLGGRLSPLMLEPPRVTGFILLDGLLAGNLTVVGDALAHLILPALSLCFGGIATAARVTRATMSDNYKKDYIQLMRAYDMPRARLMVKYLLKPSIIPTVALLGMQIGVLTARSFIVELIFVWPGISKYGLRAMLCKDLNGISAVVILIGLFYVVANFLVDIAVGFLDPRIRFEGMKSR